MLDRATRRIAATVTTARRDEERLGERLRPIVPGRIERARSGLATATGRLEALGPGATLDRGYAIVARARDGLIVRDPLEAPAGTPLRLRVARGELSAVSADLPAVSAEGS
jgi:exodeoxyribonuclease VII large subunit